MEVCSSRVSFRFRSEVCGKSSVGGLSVGFTPQELVRAVLGARKGKGTCGLFEVYYLIRVGADALSASIGLFYAI